MKPLLRSWLLVGGVAAALAALNATTNPHAAALLHDRLPPDQIALVDARQLQGPVLWLDARSEAEFTRDHIPPALPLDEEHWDAQIETVLQRWQPGTTVIVYCSQAGCGASGRVAGRLRRDYGLTDVRVLHGGWAAWQQASTR